MDEKLSAEDKKFIEEYDITFNKLITKVSIFMNKEDFVPTYHISISNISPTTKLVLEKIRNEFVSKVVLNPIEFTGSEGVGIIKTKFEQEIEILIKKYFPGLDEGTKSILINYVLRQNLGLGDIEILLKDPMLEEIVVNGSKEPIWVYHRKHGWLKTNVKIVDENRVRHYATLIGREAGKEITILNPLMDAWLTTGDRVNATLNPISDFGNTLTIRKFAQKPWTITDLIKENTLSVESASVLWLAVQNELSTLIAGGTGSGKTSTLNVVANFFPPNQRIISIEDTRELTLPDSLHWVPLETRLANPEGKGQVSMLDLVVNSLRMRPDRIIVGEIRRQVEAEVLFEAMHTGHSVYSTIHANTAEETIDRLTNPPISVPKKVISALSLIMVQNRNRRTGKRRTFQFAEVTKDGDASVFMQLDAKTDTIKRISQSPRMMDTIGLYTGLTQAEIEKDLAEKSAILKWIVSQNITDVHQIGLIMAKYYTGRLTIRKTGQTVETNPIKTIGIEKLKPTLKSAIGAQGIKASS